MTLQPCNNYVFSLFKLYLYRPSINPTNKRHQ